MKWSKYEAVQQYVDAVRKNQFVAVAAGVVVHQHTRVLMAGLHRRGDNMSAADVACGQGCSSWQQRSQLHTRQRME